jgi:undecaprenyl diphosphate synthase
MQSSAVLPQHIAIIMDGNGRWAEKRKRPRTMGHQAGVRSLRRTVEHCIKRGVSTLTVFAFSSENWNRPQAEVNRLMDLFMRALNKEVAALHENGVRVRFIGDCSAFRQELQERITNAETITRENSGLTLNVAANYGGRWDIVQATRQLSRAVQQGTMQPDEIDEQSFSMALVSGETLEPDLFIRTGGEMRISNFLLWQSAYSEFYFTEVLWPDFDDSELDRAIAEFQRRDRRFGLTGQQLNKQNNA